MDWQALTFYLGEAPSLLINLIGMFMLKVPTKQDKTWVYGTPDENGNAVAQNIIQKFLIFVAILAIPVMLLAKPYIKYKAHKGRFPRSSGNLCSLVQFW